MQKNGSKYLAVRNWGKFQHYKKHDEPAPWIKLHNQLLSDYEFQHLTEVDQCRLLKIWLLAAKTGNRIPNDPRWVRAQIGAKTLNLQTFIDAGWLEELYSDSRQTLFTAEQSREQELKSRAEVPPDDDLALERALVKLLRKLKDKDQNTEATIRKLIARYSLAEGDIMWALECATGPGVESPVKVAVAELTKRGRAK